MGPFRLDRVLDFLSGTQLVVGLLWAGLAVFTITLLIMMQTRWGQSRPLRKCIILSLLAHLLLAGYATTVQIVAGGVQAEEPVLQVSLIEGPERRAFGAEDPVHQEKPWEELAPEAIAQPEPIDPQRPQPEQPSEPQRSVPAPQTSLPVSPPLDHLALPETQPPQPEPMKVDVPSGRSSPGKSAEHIQAPAAQRREATPTSVPEEPSPQRRTVPIQQRPSPVRTPSNGVDAALLEPLVSLPRLAAEPTTPPPARSLAALIDQQGRRLGAEPPGSPAGESDGGYEGGDDPAGSEPAGQSEPSAPADHDNSRQGGPAMDASNAGPEEAPHVPSRNGVGAGGEIPEIYRLRVSPDRARLAERQGATKATETAVKAALKWLADNQGPDGRWDASDHGAGRENLIAGRNRYHAGIEADTGMTGLALLAFLASGHTHREGVYRENVRNGLQYLLVMQKGDGDLGGQGTAYARMYCHAMAACALSEAYGMTGDQRLQEPVRRAIGYTLAAQASSGGWRYRPGTPGDTSQCGWQLMALKSAELAGIPIPAQSRDGAIRYLRSACSGKHGGLAAYRPREQMSRPMTAEALVCWQFLGMPREHPAGQEAGNYLLEELPGQGEANVYYWYYATLGMYQLQGPHWQQWNDALRSTLVTSQRTTGPAAGSWDPDELWGSYGGRVYATALSTLCLEVYYRFLPLYVNAVPETARAE
jgi:hypothetical protein